MRSIRTYFGIGLLFAFVLVVAGCDLLDEGMDSDNGSNDDETYTVTYHGNGHTDGDVPQDNTEYLDGGIVSLSDAGDMLGPVTDWGSTYRLLGWTESPDGDGDLHRPGETFVISGSDIDLYALWTVIGVEGPSGGYIFYHDEDDEFEWEYLEAAHEEYDPGEIIWSPTDGDINTQPGLGEGRENTNAIIAGFGDPELQDEHDYAAWTIDQLEVPFGGESFDDWFLPSQEELQLMYDNLHDTHEPLGSFFTIQHWSSHQPNPNNASALHFNVGDWDTWGLQTFFRARAIRSF